MTQHKLTRRSVLPVLGAGLALAACGKEGGGGTMAACADPNKLSASENSTRKSLKYTPKSADAAKTCAGCAFFTATQGSCGTCKILQGPVDVTGHCESFAPKPTA